MSPSERAPATGAEDDLGSRFSGRELHDLTYDELAGVVGAWLGGRPWEVAPSGAVGGAPVARISRLVSRRAFPRFRDFVRPTGKYQRAFTELFLLARIRTYALAYLSVQEGEAFEGEDRYDTPVPRAIGAALRHLGKRSNFVVGVRTRAFALTLDLDPVCNLRRIYRGLVRKRPGALGWWSLTWNRSMFRLKSWLFGGTVRLARVVAAPAERGAVAALLGSSFFARHARQFLPVLFEDARGLSPAEWDELVARVRTYFTPRLEALLELISPDSLQNHGLIKLFKVAVGVVAGRTSVRDRVGGSAVDFIFDTLRLAYCWGITYPLVDNVLDSASTPTEVRNELAHRLRSLFSSPSPAPESGGVGGDAGLRGVAEVVARLSEALGIVSRDRGAGTRGVLRLLFEAHERDAKRRLSSVAPGAAPAAWREVLTDTALKSALVRLATMGLCGIELDARTRDRSICRGLFNQLGDDLWDIYEDDADDRVTPFTLFLRAGGVPDPFVLYYRFSEFVAAGLTRRRATAVFLGFSETLRDAVLTLAVRPDDGLEVRRHVLHLLRGSAGPPSDSAAVLAVPHVDFDAILFLFEEATLECLI